MRLSASGHGDAYGMSKVRQAERHGQCEGFSRKPPRFGGCSSAFLTPASLKEFASPRKQGSQAPRGQSRQTGSQNHRNRHGRGPLAGKALWGDPELVEEAGITEVGLQFEHSGVCAEPLIAGPRRSTGESIS